MSASSSLFLTVSLSCLAMSANALKCWVGTNRIELMPKNREQCPSGTVFCAKLSCLVKFRKMRYILMRCESNSSSTCERDYHYYDENESRLCDKMQCCRGDLCNSVPDRAVHQGPLAVCVVFAVLSAMIFSVEFVKPF